jgi:hypothetical protein
MSDLIHYIFVRKDLPLGVLAAMVTHAAGESGALYQDEYNGRFRGATAVVLEANDEAHLRRIDKYLSDNALQRVCVVESGGVYTNQLMSIGCVPGRRAALSHLLAKFVTLKVCLDNPPQTDVSSVNPINETNKGSKEAPDIPR